MIPDPNKYYRHYNVEDLTTLIISGIGDPYDGVSEVNDTWTLEEALMALRVERNKRLAESDWTQLNDIALSNVEKLKWAIYRQALRDLPENVVWDVTKWPEKP